MERSLRQALQISGGDYSVFVTQPISAALLAVAALSLLLPLIRGLRTSRSRDPRTSIPR